MKKIQLTMMVLSFFVVEASCQYSSKLPRHFGSPILTDTTSTFFFPIQYNEELLSTHKIAFWGSYYANLVVYDFKSDTHKRLFEADTYIESFRNTGGVYGHEFEGPNPRLKNITAKWVFLLVKNEDTNANGRIDDHDPAVLYVTTIKGENLKPLTRKTENVVSFEIFKEQNFALIKIQRDVNGDRSFKNQDNDFTYRKIDLNDLTLGKEIELN